MIIHTYGSKRPPSQVQSFLPPPVVKQTGGFVPLPNSLPKEERPNDSDKRRAQQFGITPEEFIRRDKIVRQMWIDCQVKPGQVVRPIMDQAYEEYGPVAVRGVFKSYHDFPEPEARAWPKDDRPFILTVEPQKGKPRLLVVTPQWVVPFTQQTC